MTNAQGLDVSNWQGAFDWRGHPSIDFAAAKAGEHQAMDPTFPRNWDDMRATFDNRNPRIAYWFFHPGEAMAPQVDALVQVARDHGLQLGDHFAADIEETDGCSADEVRSFARAASHRVNVKAPDHRCFGYTFSDFAAPWGTWPLWIANTGVPAPQIPAAWGGRWYIWQWTQRGLDLDRWNGDRAHMLNFCRMPADRR